MIISCKSYCKIFRLISLQKYFQKLIFVILLQILNEKHWIKSFHIYYAYEIQYPFEHVININANCYEQFWILIMVVNYNKFHRNNILVFFVQQFFSFNCHFMPFKLYVFIILQSCNHFLSNMKIIHIFINRISSPRNFHIYDFHWYL